MTGMNRLFGARFNRLGSILTIVIDVAVKGGDFGGLVRKNRSGYCVDWKILARNGGKPPESGNLLRIAQSIPNPGQINLINFLMICD